MNFNESLFTFISRQLIRIKKDQLFGTANDNSVIKPSFKKYLKLYLINKYPFIYKHKIRSKFKKEKNKINPTELININKSIIDSHETFAFDVFDTIIYRKIPPESIKDLVANFIAKETRVEYARIRHLRSESEIEVGQNNLNKGFDSDNRYDDVVSLWLKKLKKEFPSTKFPNKEAIREYEIKKEVECQFVKKPIIDFLKLLKIKNKKIIFISDFYFDSKIINLFLKELKCDIFFDKGYCSCEYLLSKNSGRLYEKLINKKIISPNKTIMIGDNPHSDGLSAQKYKIKNFLLYDLEQKYQNYKMELTENLKKQNCFFNGASIEELISNTLKIRKDYDYNQGLLLAPIYISFVEKIISYCELNNIKNIYFLSREGKTFLNIFNKINDNPKLSGKYLITSRKATFLMSMKNMSIKELNRIWKQYSNQTPKQLLTNLNLPENLLKIFNENDIDNDQIIDSYYNFKKLNIIFTDEEFQKEFTAIKKEQTDYFKKYLKSINFYENGKIALIDIGWKGSIQDNLYKITKKEIHGLYFGYLNGQNETLKNNIKIGLISDTNHSNWYEKNLFKNGPLFEMSTTPNEGSCVGYDSDGPITKQYQLEKENYKNYFSKTQKAILDYVNEYTKHRDLGLIDVQNLHHFWLDRIIRFILYPSSTEAKSFLKYSHIESFGIQKTSKFNYKWRWKYVFLNMKPVQIIKRFKENFYNQFWINGILKRTHIPLITFFFNMKTKQ